MVMLMILAVEIVGTHDDILLANAGLMRAYAQAATPGNTRAGDGSRWSTVSSRAVLLARWRLNVFELHHFADYLHG